MTEKMNLGPSQNKESLDNSYYKETKEQIEKLKEYFDTNYNKYISFTKNRRGGYREASMYARQMRTAYDSVWLQIKKFRTKFPDSSREFNDLNNIKIALEEQIEFLRNTANPENLIDTRLPINLKDRSTEPNESAKSKQELRNRQRGELTEKFIEIDTFLKGKNNANSDESDSKGIILSPKDFDYDELSVNDSSKSGEYSLNPEVQNIDFEKAEPFTIPTYTIKEKISNNSDAIKYAVENYGEGYYLPGIEYGKWLIEHQDMLPQNIKEKFKDKHLYLLPGSIAIKDFGSACVPMLAFFDKIDGNKFGLEYNSINGSCYYPDGSTIEILLIKK